ncbi:hypothetical protein [Kallotenue papyrolyticum]|uniref:hypothetical protein n=1 Tax=Kallotenue papyrolyticum TaxID=1325125 RepID=UPI00046F7C05|nr:hypothetical protein [Kallotenue papyrolyticum]
MLEVSIQGRVVRATDLQPLSGVALRLVADSTALAGLPDAQPLPPRTQVRWTRRLTGFAGTRWECWKAHVEGRIPDLSWQQFRDQVLAYNPALRDEPIFRADATYLLPEVTPLPSYTWTRHLTGFAGTRRECWEQHVAAQVPGLSWERFRDEVLRYNPQLNADGRLFRPYRSYLLPEPAACERALLQCVTDTSGAYYFKLGSEPVVGELQIELEEYLPLAMPVVVNDQITQPLLLYPRSTATPAGRGWGRSGTLRSAHPAYPYLPFKVRRLIDRALFLLGDDTAVFDALPPEARALCYGARFAHDPDHPHSKELLCADVVSIALTGAGLRLDWLSTTNPHLADAYHPDRGAPHLVEIEEPDDWQPGDLLVYGRGDPASRAEHVALYVGPFVGVDRSGRAYHPGDGADVVEGSIRRHSNGATYGTGVSGVSLARCLQSKRGLYAWVRHVRLRELDALWQRLRQEHIAATEIPTPK